MKQTSDHSEIQQFFNGLSVFITGSTGFLGKLLLEKILRLTEVKNVYLLIREKNGEDPNTRLKKLFECPIFDQVKASGINYMEKIVVLPGDCSIPGLGLSSEHRATIIKDVDCIFHLACNTDFDENFVNSLKTNILSTNDLIELAKEIKQLKCFIYPSSVYANLINKRVLEEFYPTPIDGENLIQIINNIEHNLLDSLKDKLMNYYNNVYLLTKAITEDLLRKKGKGMPISIVRSSFATATLEEPVSGFIQNYNGPTGLLVGKMLGVIKIAPMITEFKIDIVPADFIISHLLAVGWQTANAHLTRTKAEIKEPKDITIYHCVSSEQNPITWNELEVRFSNSYERQPSKYGIWYPLALNTKCIYNFMLMSFILHTIPAYIGYYLGLLLGKNCGAVEAYGKIDKFLNDFKRFTMNEYEFTNDNSIKLLNKLTFKDRKLFNFDMLTINWESYVEFYTKGCRVYILNDKLEGMAEALKRYKRLKIINFITMFFVGVFTYFLIRCSLRCTLKILFNIRV